MVHYLNDICGIDKARKLYNLTKSISEDIFDYIHLIIMMGYMG
jgi:hypothetical protein